MLIVGDFNLDQMLTENITKLYPLIERFNLYQRSRYSTHIHVEILDLVCGSTNSWVPAPYSDHFLILVQI